MGSVRLSYMNPVDLAALTIDDCEPSAISQAWNSLFDWFPYGRHECKRGKGYGLTYCDAHSGQLTPRQYIAGVEVPRSWRSSDNKFVSQQRFNGGPYSVVQYCGTYEEISDAAAIVEKAWQPPRGATFDDRRPIVTFFHTDPSSTSAGDQIADICVPIAVEFVS